MSDYLVQEDGSSKILQENGDGLLLQGTGGGGAAGLVGAGSKSVTSHLPTTFTASGGWTCPPDVHFVIAEAYGGGGGGGGYAFFVGGGGGGGGAYAKRLVPVTPGNTYTVTVGAGGSSGAGGDSSFTGDSSIQVVAKGGSRGSTSAGPSTAAGGTGGTAAASTGTLKQSGGTGGTGVSFNGGGGGASASSGGNGANGSGRTGGTGVSGGGSGGRGGTNSNPTGDGTAGTAPGGGGGGAAGANAGGGSGQTANGYDGAAGQITISPAVTSRGLHVVANVGVPVSYTGKRGLHATANVGANATFSGKRGLHAVASITRVLVSQEAIEVVYKTSNAKSRVSQEAVEVVAKYPVLGNRISQVAVEVLIHDRTLIPFISSVTTVYPLTLVADIALPFIGSVTAVYPPALFSPEIDVPFIGSNTHVWPLWSFFNPTQVYSGPGNGGEAFALRLAPNGVSVTASLTHALSATDTIMYLVGDASFPSSASFVVTVGSEVMGIRRMSSGVYFVWHRAFSNTVAASHSSGSTAVWTDSYDMAIVAGENINASFTADINDTGSYTYPGWLVCFDSSQAYLSGDRYPFHVTEVVGVFDADAGTGGTNRLDGPQPNAVSTPIGVSDDCPAALANPARIATDISTGDVAIVRYTNPEGVALDLGPRATSLQSWFGLKRVDASDNDVTLTDPDGYVVDTIPSGPGPGPFTGSVNGEWPDPVPLQIGIAKDASEAAGYAVPTPSPVAWETVTLPGSDRYFTDSIHFNEKGWPMCCLAVRQGNRRVPYWQSWDWRDYSYTFTGFGTDATYAQILINRNGIVFDSVPEVELPGPQDINGPDVYWDDGTYFFGASWYIVLFSGPYIVFGPVIGGTPAGGPSGSSSPVGGFAPGVSFPGGTPVVQPPFIEGGSGGGGIAFQAGLHIWQRF